MAVLASSVTPGSVEAKIELCVSTPNLYTGETSGRRVGSCCPLDRPKNRLRICFRNANRFSASRANQTLRSAKNPCFVIEVKISTEVTRDLMGGVVAASALSASEVLVSGSTRRAEDSVDLIPNLRLA